MAINRDRLIKLLNMTKSEHDAEALSAIRLSNVLLRQHRVTWEDVLGSMVQPLPKMQDVDATDDEPILKASVPAGWRAYQETNTAQELLYGRIRSVSPVLRIVFFPVTVFAWLYVGAVHRERWPLKAIAMLVPVFGGGVAAVAWAAILLGIAKLVRIV